LREDYSNYLIQILGEERASALMRQSQDVFRDALNEFGQAPHAVTVLRKQDGSISTGEMYFWPNGTPRLNSAGGDIRMPETLKATLEAWKNATSTPTQTP